MTESRIDWDDECDVRNELAELKKYRLCDGHFNGPDDKVYTLDPTCVLCMYNRVSNAYLLAYEWQCAGEYAKMVNDDGEFYWTTHAEDLRKALGLTEET